MALAQGRHLDRIVADERRLDELLLAVLAEDGVDELAFAHRLVDFDTQPPARFAQLFLGLAGDVVAGLFADGFGHRHAAERRLERDGLAVDRKVGRPVGGQRHMFEHLLGELHHPQVVLVGDVDLHAGEFGVVRAVHALVAEVLAELVDPFETAYDEFFEVELRGDAKVEVDVERVVVRDERPRRGAARNGLQNRRFDFEIPLRVEELAHGRHDLRALDEDFAHLRVDRQIDITLAVAYFGVGEGVERLPVLLLDYRQRPQRLGDDGQPPAVYRRFARLGDEGEALDPHEITDVEQFLEDGVVERRVTLGADVVAADVDLDAARVILQFEERDAAHDAARHDAAGDAHVGEIPLRLVVSVENFPCRGRDVEACGGVGVDAQFPQCGQRLAAQLLLFAEFDCHILFRFCFTCY